MDGTVIKKATDETKFDLERKTVLRQHGWQCSKALLLGPDN